MDSYASSPVAASYIVLLVKIVVISFTLIALRRAGGRGGEGDPRHLLGSCLARSATAAPCSAIG